MEIEDGSPMPLSSKAMADINEALERGGIDNLPHSKEESMKDPRNLLYPPYNFYDLERMHHMPAQEDLKKNPPVERYNIRSELYGRLTPWEVRQPIGASYDWIRRYEVAEQNVQEATRGLNPEEAIQLQELKDRFLDTVRYEMMIKDGSDLKLSEAREVFRYAQKVFDAFMNISISANNGQGVFGETNPSILDALGRALTVSGDINPLTYQVRVDINEALVRGGVDTLPPSP